MFISHLGTVCFDVLLKDFCAKGKKREKTKENKSNETEYIVECWAFTRFLRLHVCDGFKII